jgi:predicted small secreted protein
VAGPTITAEVISMSVMVHRIAAVLVLAAAVSLSACATGNGVHQDFEATKQTIKDSAHAAKEGIVDTAHAAKEGVVDTAHTIKYDVKGDDAQDSD